MAASDKTSDFGLIIRRIVGVVPIVVGVPMLAEVGARAPQVMSTRSERS